MTDAIVTGRVSVAPQKTGASQGRQWPVMAIWFGLFGLQAFVSLVLAPYGANETGGVRDQWMFVSFGAFVSQPLLMAIAAGLWTGRWYLAAPASLVLVGLLAHFANFANVAALNRATYGDIELPIIWGVTYLCLLAPPTIARWLGGWRIQPPRSTAVPGDSHRFRLLGLMGTVTAVAVVLGVVRVTAVPMQWSEHVKRPVTVLAETLVTGGAIAVCLCGTMPLVGMVLATSGRQRHVAASLLGLAAGAAFLWWLIGPSNPETVLAWALICCGAVASLVVNLGALRWCGFRLVRVTRVAGQHVHDQL